MLVFIVLLFVYGVAKKSKPLPNDKKNRIKSYQSL